MANLCTQTLCNKRGISADNESSEGTSIQQKRKEIYAACEGTLKTSVNDEYFDKKYETLVANDQEVVPEKIVVKTLKSKITECSGNSAEGSPQKRGIHQKFEDMLSRFLPKMPSEADSIKLPEFKHHCPECRIMFICEETYVNHLVNHEKPKEKRIQCHLCGALYIKMQNYLTHMQTHKGEETEGSIGELLVHRLGKIQNEKSIFKQYTCEYCGKSLQHNSYRIHVRRHTGNCPHTCKMCDKVFPTVHELKRHTLLHTSENPHTCKFCGVLFTCRSKLTLHLKMHTEKKR